MARARQGPSALGVGGGAAIETSGFAGGSCGDGWIRGISAGRRRVGWVAGSIPTPRVCPSLSLAIWPGALSHSALGSARRLVEIWLWSDKDDLLSLPAGWQKQKPEKSRTRRPGTNEIRRVPKYSRGRTRGTRRRRTREPLLKRAKTSFQLVPFF